MNRGGNGIGSASIVLIFAVLCMIIFTMISFVSARNDKALADAQERLVKGYYEADARAEYILSKILTTEVITDIMKINGVNVTAERAADSSVKVSFNCPLSEDKDGNKLEKFEALNDKGLYVEITVRENSYDIEKWRIQSAGTWEIDDSLPVFTGTGLPGFIN